MKKPILTLILIITIAFSTATSIHSTEIAKANWMAVPDKPLKDLPIIQVQSPKENATYFGIVPVNFTVTMPQAWEPNSRKPYGGITYVNYTVDGETYTIFAGDNWVNLPTTSVYNFSIAGLTEGNHTLRIFVGGSAVYLSSYEGFNGDYPIYEVNNSASINFRVSNQSVSSPETSNMETWSLVVLPSAIIIGLGIVIYRRKHSTKRIEKKLSE